MKNNDIGRSLMEMMGVIAVIGALTIGALNGFQKGMGKLKVKKVKDQIADISTSIRTLYMQHETYEGLNNQSAVNMQVLPLDMGTGEHLLSPFRGNVTIGTGKVLEEEPANSAKAFYLIYDKINRESCIELASADWGGKGVSILAVGVFGHSVDAATIEDVAKGVYYDYEGYDGEYGIATPQGSVLSIPIPLYKAIKLCNCDNQSLSCTMLWKYQ